MEIQFQVLNFKENLKLDTRFELVPADKAANNVVVL